MTISLVAIFNINFHICCQIIKLIESYFFTSIKRLYCIMGEVGGNPDYAVFFGAIGASSAMVFSGRYIVQLFHN